MKKKFYFKNINLFRFIFACMIVTFHMIHMSLNNLKMNTDFKFMLENSWNLGHCVELFFVMSGFFLIITYKKDISAVQFLKNKIVRLWPIMIFTMLIFSIASLFKVLHLYLMEDIFTLLFLNGLFISKHTTPFNGTGNMHSTWFVSSLIFSSALYTYIIKNYGYKLLNLLLFFIITIGLYSFSYRVPLVIPESIIRGLYGVGIGVLCGQIYIVYKDKIKTIQKVKSKFINVIFTLIELGIFFYLIFGLCFGQMDRLVLGDFIFLFIIIFFLFIIKIGYFSKLLNNNLSVELGKYAYAIFVTHCFWVEIFGKYWFTEKYYIYFKELISFHPTILFAYIPIIFSIVFGIIAYYIIEKPTIKFLKSKNYIRQEISNRECKKNNADLERKKSNTV